MSFPDVVQTLIMWVTERGVDVSSFWKVGVEPGALWHGNQNELVSNSRDVHSGLCEYYCAYSGTVALVKRSGRASSVIASGIRINAKQQHDSASEP